MSTGGNPIVLLDACVTINLLASGVSLHEYSTALGVSFAMTDVAAGETLYLPAVSEIGGEQAADVVETFDVGELDGLSVVRLIGDEIESFVRFARDIDDGEASTLAAAAHRGLPVATDDRKAQRLAASTAPPVRTIGTTNLLRQWSERGAPAPGRVKRAVRLIERRASYFPRRDDPNFQWWAQVRDE